MKQNLTDRINLRNKTALNKLDLNKVRIERVRLVKQTQLEIALQAL